MSNAEKRFNQELKIAKQLKRKRNFGEARLKYNKIIREFENNKNIDYIDYIVVMSQLGDIEKELNLISESKARYIKAFSLLSQAPKEVPYYEIQKEKHHLLSNLGLIFCHEVQNIDIKKDYKKFKSLLDENVKYYKVCQEIVVKMIMENQDKFEQQEDENKPDWWKTQYVGLIVNLSEVLSMQGFEFQDKYVMDLMIRLIQKAQQFYELCKNRTKEHLKHHLSQTFYYKAICLKFLNKKKESEKYFIKDLKHCQENKLQDELEKTKIEMFKFYLQNFRFNEAREVYKTKDYIEQVNERQRYFKKVMIRAQQMKSRLKKGREIDAVELEDILFELHELKCPQKSLQFNLFMRQANQFKTNHDFRYWLEYYAAQFCIKLGNFQQASKYLKEAINSIKNIDIDKVPALQQSVLKCKEAKQRGWCSLLNAIILDNTQKDRTKVYQAYEKCVYDSIYGDEDCEIQCKKYFQAFKFNEERKKSPITYDMSLSEKLINYMRQMKQKRIQQKNNRMEIQPQQIEMIPQQLEEEIYRPQKKLIRPLLSEMQSYVQNCKILNQQPIEVFKELLKNSNEINLSKLIYFNPEQLLALLNSTSKISNLDLTNFVMTTQYLKKIRETSNSNSFKQIKVNMINASIIKDSERIDFYQQLYSLLRSNPLLERLLISNAYDSEQLTKIIQSNDIICLQSLTVIKLKQCQLQDKDLIFLQIGDHLPQLKKLSLSANKLQGKTLQVLTSLKSLQSLSLSSNPLNEITLTRKFDSLKKISLNNLSNSISSQVRALFIPILTNCEIIKMKNCESVCEDILIKLIENVMNLQTSLHFLKRLNLFGSQLKGSSIVQTLANFQRKAPKLVQIDLRNTKILSTQNSNMLTIQNQLKQLQTAFNHHESQFYLEIQQDPLSKKSFKTTNLTIIVDQINPKKYKNFSINY